MNKKTEISNTRAWLMVLASLADDVLVLALIFLGLWYFKIKITWPIILIVVAAIVAFAFIMHRAVIPALRRKKVTGAEAMVGTIGVVTETLKPAGMVKINDEYWQAISSDGEIVVGTMVEVIKINGLHLEVRKKES